MPNLWEFCYVRLYQKYALKKQFEKITNDRNPIIAYLVMPDCELCMIMYETGCFKQKFFQQNLLTLLEAIKARATI